MENLSTKNRSLESPPVYVSDDSVAPSSAALSKYSALKQAALQGKPGLRVYRSEFLDSCLEYIDSLRVRRAPKDESLGAQIIADCGKLRHVRNHIVDWVILETNVGKENDFGDALVSFLEKLREMKSRPIELTTWQDQWFGAHAVFVYETFLYIVASLLKAGSHELLHEIFTSHYILPESERFNDRRFETFDCFYGRSGVLGSALNPEGGRQYLRPEAELIKRQADRRDIPFQSLMEAELLILLMSFLTPAARWYPGTLLYSTNGADFPFFLRARQHKGFRKLATITGIESADQLRIAIAEGAQRVGVNAWHDFGFNGDFSEAMNLAKLDTWK